MDSIHNIRNRLYGLQQKGCNEDVELSFTDKFINYTFNNGYISEVDEEYEKVSDIVSESNPNICYNCKRKLIFKEEADIFQKKINLVNFYSNIPTEILNKMHIEENDSMFIYKSKRYDAIQYYYIHLCYGCLKHGLYQWYKKMNYKYPTNSYDGVTFMSLLNTVQQRTYSLKK